MSKILKQAVFLLVSTAYAFGTKAAFAEGTTVAGVGCESGLCRLAATGVPLKVLPRPFSTIYREKNVRSEIVDSTVPAFAPLYVFSREDVEADDADSRIGWYKVGFNDETSSGWMHAADVVEWHNSLILSYTPIGVGDEKRSRVIGFTTLDKLQGVALGKDRLESASALFQELGRRKPGDPITRMLADAGVVSAEPEGVFRDIKDTFFMWPILSWSQPDEEEEERFVEFVQLVPNCRNDYYSSNIAHMNSESTKYLQGDQFGTAKRVEAADIVFVVDTTSSMVPYLEAVKRGISQAAGVISKAEGSIKFGFVGYQDDHRQLEYVTRDYFANGLVDADVFVETVTKEVKVERWGKHMIPERMFEGFSKAIGSSWRENSIKFIVLISDAPGIPQSDGNTHDPQLVTEEFISLIDTDPTLFKKLVEVSLNDARNSGRAASDANIQVLAVFIDPGIYPEISEVAERQFSYLPQNENTEEGFIRLDGSSGTITGFDLEIRKVAEKITRALGIESVEDLALPESGESGGKLSALPVDSLVEAAVMEHLGTAKIDDCDYRGWTTDRDLADAAVRALDVNVMLNHRQFDTLYKTVRDVHRALTAGEITGRDFIDSLQSVGTFVIADPDAIEKARSGSLASSGVLPRWLVGLPYHSDIAYLSAEDINDMTSSDRLQLEVNIGNKLQRYEAVISNNDLWHSLSNFDGGKIESRVTPVPLEDLP